MPQKSSSPPSVAMLEARIMTNLARVQGFLEILQSEIDKTDREIDLMVYKLYGLTERDIRIVEGRD